MQIKLILDSNTNLDNKNWKLQYSEIDSEEKIDLNNIELNNISDAIIVDVSDNWERFYITAIDDEFSYATFESGSI